MSCVTPCLITAGVILVVLIIVHVVLYIKLLELSKERYGNKSK
jgi:hypothetical protein